MQVTAHRDHSLSGLEIFSAICDSIRTRSAGSISKRSKLSSTASQNSPLWNALISRALVFKNLSSMLARHVVDTCFASFGSRQPSTRRTLRQYELRLLLVSLTFLSHFIRIHSTSTNYRPVRMNDPVKGLQPLVCHIVACDIFCPRSYALSIGNMGGKKGNLKLCCV